jgi:tRNA modification GTPase
MKDKIGIYSKDTIAAVSTPLGSGGIGVIKISGLKAMDIILKVFKPHRDKDLNKVGNYTLHYGWVVDKGALIDEVLIGIMRSPYSYTKEDVVEIYSHSGCLVLNKVLDSVLAQGARLADPGEFTKRAFLSGRIDLIQAESVLDIVNAKSDQHLSLSMFQLKGDLSSRINKIGQALEDIIVRLEADISFPEEDTRIPLSLLKNKIMEILSLIRKLLRDSDKARFLREGVRCVICGKSNVGKSSLLNLLLKEERVIVTSVAGTTRDVVEESINIKGLPIKISDTAGIILPRDLIEEKAVSQSYKKIEQADLVLVVFDGSKKLSRQDRLIIDKTEGKNRIFVINKVDLKQNIEKQILRKDSENFVEISAIKDIGVKELEDVILKSIWKGFGRSKKESVLVSNIRHINLLKETEFIISSIKKEKSYGLDFVLFSLQDAKSKIDQISGKEFSRDILDSVFNNFCIGK